jgi:hypothetical protein
MFQFPGFASTPYEFRCRYPKGVGCPIRTPRDQRLLAAPPRFSQRATSFIASWRQGIHQMPFSCSKPNNTAIRPKPQQRCIKPRTEPIQPKPNRSHTNSHTHFTPPDRQNAPKPPTTPKTKAHKAPRPAVTSTRAVPHAQGRNRTRFTINKEPQPQTEVRPQEKLLKPDISWQFSVTRQTHAVEAAARAAPGDDRDRTDDPLLAKQVLSQLSYAPSPVVSSQSPVVRAVDQHVRSASDN